MVDLKLYTSAYTVDDVHLAFMSFASFICFSLSLLPISVSPPPRPEADDVRAMQQQLSSLHLVLEQSNSEHERELQSAQMEKTMLEEEKKR